MKTRTIEIPGYLAGTWAIDPVHSDVSFTVRHLMVSKVRGKFHGVDGEIVLADDPLASSVHAEVDLRTLDTGNTDRDDHIRSADFFEVERYPTMAFQSMTVEPDENDHFAVAGNLTLHGCTNPLVLALEVNGFATDPSGGRRAGFTATSSLNRKDYGITVDLPLDGGGVVIGDKVTIALEIQAVLRHQA